MVNLIKIKQNNRNNNNNNNDNNNNNNDNNNNNFNSKIKINDTFKTLFLETINETFPFNKSRSKNSFVYDDLVFLELILYRFSYVTSWRALGIFYKKPFNGPHHTSVFKKFSFWREHNIFFKVWKKYLNNKFLNDFI